MNRYLQPFVSLLLFVAALLPRLPGLSRFLTTDESYFIVSAGSNVIQAVLQAEFRDTYWHFYPGVTLSWLEAMGIVGQYFLSFLGNNSLPPFATFIHSDVLSLLVAVRMPFVILSALAVPALYLLARKLLPWPVALVGAIFMAFDPFYLAHSRVAHGDAPVAVFMGLSVLCFFVVAQSLRPANPESPGLAIKEIATNPYLVASAVFGGLAALTKAPGQFMAPFVIGMALLYTGLDWRNAEKNEMVQRIAVRWAAVVTIWGFISLVTFIVLWPSMWVDPVGTFRQMLAETFSKVNEGHLVFFMGQPTLDPGPWFYPFVIPFRLTPVTLVGSLLSLVLFLPVARKTSAAGRVPAQPSPLFLLWLFTLLLLLFGNLSPKKQDRYLLPLFPMLSLLAAIGWLGVFELAAFFLARGRASYPTLFPLLPPLYTLLTILYALLLILLQALPLFTYYPYYLTYFNPLLGGPQRAAETTLMGWGEGMEQVAAYLNRKPNAAELYVAATPSQTLLPYFAGAGENFYTNDIALRADYVVLYLAQMQRLAPSPEIIRYYQAQTPEKIIEIKSVPYAKIYANTPRILADIPPQATPANIGLGDKLRLAGYRLDPAQPALTLYWHALAPMDTNYTISVRAYAAGGERLFQQDQWPVEGLLPTSQWRQGDYVADAHRLPLSSAAFARIQTFEVVVYNADSGQTLGPPLTITHD